jgi:hypothetical protein
MGRTPVTETYEPDPDDEADDDLAAERAGQSTTAEEAMDAVSPEDGHVDESAYTPAHGLEEQIHPKEDELR